MARKVKQSVVVGAQNVVAQTEAQPAAPQETRGKRSAKRKEIILRGADGKPAHGLTDVASVQALGYTFAQPATHLVVKAQFKTAHHWYAFCAWRAMQEAEHYNQKATDAAANPDAYKRVAASTKLAARVKELEALLAQLQAQGAQ